MLHLRDIDQFVRSVPTSAQKNVRPAEMNEAIGKTCVGEFRLDPRRGDLLVAAVADFHVTNTITGGHEHQDGDEDQTWDSNPGRCRFGYYRKWAL